MAEHFDETDAILGTTNRKEFAKTEQTDIDDTPERSNSSLFKPKYILVLFQDCLPVFFGLTITFSVGLFTLHFLSQSEVDSATLQAYGLGTSFMDMLTFAIVYALNNGLTNRCAQAYGTRDFKLVGLYFHRAMIINISILLLCCIPLLLFPISLLSLIGTETAVAEMVKDLILSKIVGAFALGFYMTLSSAFNGCDRFVAPAVIQLISTIIHIILGYYFIVVYKFGLVGVGLSASISWLIAAVTIVVYTIVKDPLPGVFFYPIKESYEEIWSLFKYEFIIGVMSWCDIASVLIINLIGAGLPSQQYAGFAVACSVYFFIQPFCLSLGLTTMTHVSNYMGASRQRTAKKFFVAGLILGWIGAIVLEVLCHIEKKRFINLVIKEETSFSLAVQLFTLLLLQLPIDSTNAILNSGIKGIGKEKIGALVLVICDYGGLIPLSYILCYNAEYGVFGFVYASIITQSAKVVGFSLIYLTTNWKDQVEIILQAIHKEKPELEHPDEADKSILE